MCACEPSPGEKAQNAPASPAQNNWAPLSFPLTPNEFATAFNGQAALDRTDATEGCSANAEAMLCGFGNRTFLRAAPRETGAVENAGEQMPDEGLSAGVSGSRIAYMNYLGSNETTARRTHYIAQFKTLLRVLSPGLAEADAEAAIDELHLRSTPSAHDIEHTSKRRYAVISCFQEREDEGAAINCRIDPPS